MSIYGYKKSVVDKRYGLLELREISFEFSPKDLRRIARFLEHFADELESGSWRSSHAHLECFDPAWRTDHPATEIIVLNPTPEPPARAE